ncbi:RNA 2',3'-cyclic phosphodiesterase [Desulfotomaculum copahuensis]|uniref:RNA 2',3'-cyclic phosphodiesterase n=1 Tax=Desulfotomaculum copahuensis TaxID=1838280 RepID=A0A1B7LHP9_9FIRM|nr:RNA 2',3'-cyclic phosphodiesterase [Desulfotomaculum copahuensis]OAT85807.1 2'-5' RNA ligase [Desulfotomaculum copahuensis]
MSPVWRLFWAVNLPPVARAALAQVQAALKEAGADVKWVEAENLHLTIQFLGETPAGRVQAIVRAVQDMVAVGPFGLHLSGLGVFSGRDGPRVVWAGVRQGGDSLASLHCQVGEAMRPLGYIPEKRFSPHLTLARIRSSRGVAELMQLIAALAATHLGDITVSSVDLMQSELSRRGPVYTLLSSVRLPGGV